MSDCGCDSGQTHSFKHDARSFELVANGAGFRLSVDGKKWPYAIQPGGVTVEAVEETLVLHVHSFLVLDGQASSGVPVNDEGW